VPTRNVHRRLARVGAFVAGKKYWLINRAYPGNWHVDQLEVNVEHLKKDVPGCHNPWCVGLNPFRERWSHTVSPYPSPVLSSYNVPGVSRWND
jgi:hypothetical protein